MPSTSVGLCSFLLASLLCASPALAKRNEHRPVYSPDGSEVIFMSMSDKTNGDWELYRMNSDGSNVIRLTSHQGWDGYAVWSPKDEEIIFDRGAPNGGEKSPHYMDLSSKAVKPLGAYQGWLSVSTWSPDGNTLAGFHETEEQRDLVFLELDGSIEKRLTDTPKMAEHDAHYSPDGKSIAFASGPTGGSGSSLELIVIETNKRHVLHTSIGRIYGVSWSPDGSRIAFATNRDGNFEIYVMNRDGSGLANLSNHPGGDFSPAWAPDGSRIAFYSDRDGTFSTDSDIWVMDLEW